MEESLREIILAQSSQEVGIPVLLFTSATLTEDPADLPGGEPGPHPVEPVAAAAAAVGVDLDALTLFSTEAYLLQVALGGRLLPERA